MKTINKDDIRRILLFQTAFLGDVVLTTPLFKNIKERFNNASVTALVIPPFAPIVEGNPYVDSVMTYDKKAKGKTKNFFRTIKKINREGFDLVISLHRSFRTGLLISLTNIPLCVGFADSAFKLGYNKRVKRDLSLHDVKRNLSILTGAGMEASELTDELLVPHSLEDEASVILKMKAKGVTCGKPIVVINPGSVWETKRYPYASFAEVIKMLNKEGSFDIIVTGGDSDRELVDKLMSLCPGMAVNMAGDTSLKELAALLDMAALMITNDSGPTHIAASFNTPIVAIYGPTTKELGFFPYNEKSIVLEKELSCRPCGKHGGHKCPTGTFECMLSITPTEVYDAALNMLNNSFKNIR